jgi:hypothetical protein
MEWMESHSNVELIFTAEFHKVFVTADTSGFQCLRTELFIFIGNEMNAKWKFLDECFLSAQIKDTDFRVWNTTTETRFWVRLVLTITVAEIILMLLEFIILKTFVTQIIERRAV